MDVDPNRLDLQNLINPNLKIQCQYCLKKISIYALEIHEKRCYLNPENKKLCPVCKKPIRKFDKRDTCSKRCAVTYERETGIPVRNFTSKHRKICFTTHGRKCLLCDEILALTVHHFDGNRRNCNPENLLPLCHNHHYYAHIERLKHLVIPKLLIYLANFKNNGNGNGGGNHGGYT